MAPTLRQKTNGVWYVDLRRGNEGVRRSLKTRNRAEAESRAMAYLAEESEEGGAERPHSLDSVVAWYTDVCLAQRRKTYRDQVAAVLRLFKTWLIKKGVPEDNTFTNLTVLAWVGDMSATLKPSTIKGRLVVLRSMLSAAVDNGIMATAPVTKWPRIKQPHRQIEIYTAEQLEAIFRYTREAHPKFVPVIQFLAATGLRRSDIVTLKWEYMDMKRRRMVLHQFKSDVKLDVSLSQSAIEALVASGPRDKGPVWPWLTLGRYSWYFEAATAALGFGVRSHRFRHTIGVMLAEAGTPLPVIQRILGHAHVSTTLAYQHFREGTEKAPLSLVSEIIERAKSGVQESVQKSCKESS